MNNQPDQPDWNPQPSYPDGQPQWAQPQPQQQYNQQAWHQPPATNYMPPQYGQPQNMPGQYNVPFYAQAQPQSQQQQNNFLMRWLMMGIAVRIVILVVIPLLLCGGCAMVALLSTAFGH
ncbi:MAG TPA: hypothetical protein VFK47_20110 [Ktedonobacteraceae bacterium]|nr:hypothetical protein [Ktedonobacteraceae bacterium]